MKESKHLPTVYYDKDENYHLVMMPNKEIFSMINETTVFDGIVNGEHERYVIIKADCNIAENKEAALKIYE